MSRRTYANLVHRLLNIGFVATSVLLLATGCSWLLPDDDLGYDTSGPSLDTLGPVIPPGLGLDEPCSPEDCRAGLSCRDGFCQPTGESPEDSVCLVADECAEGLTCSLLGFCIATGEGQEGDACMLKVPCAPWETPSEDNPCATQTDCGAGLYCQMVGFTGRCAPVGEGSLGDSCSSRGDCRGGLICGARRTCEEGNVLFGLELFPGAACTAPEDIEPPFRVLFEVPRGGEPLDEFYALPFPNDIRLVDGHPDLTGHPTPGPSVIDVDVVERIVDALAEDLEGWSTNPAVYFRFSQSPDFETLQDGETIRMVDIDPDSPDYGSSISVGWSATTGRGLYMCYNILSLRPSWARPLAGGRTYAAYLTTGIRNGDGEAAQRSPDLAAVLGETVPSDPDLAAAHATYAPLRSYLAEEGIASSTIAGAAVFTTLEPNRVMGKVREAVRAAGAITFEDVVKCGEGVTSPCDDGLSGSEHERGCMGSDPLMDEYQGLIYLPVLQHGTPPYLTPAEGGDIRTDANGVPEVARTEPVCFSMTVPKGEPPAPGWPVVIFSHGTGGNYRNHITSGIANVLAEIDLDDGEEPVRFATIGIDQVQHATRRGDSEESPEVLFFNPFNPAGSFGNVVQGAADQHALVFALEGAMAAPSAPLVSEMRVDPDRIYYIGHSQGGTVGVPFLANEPSVPGGVLSGTGGSLVLSVLNKTSPQDIPSAVAAVLQEEKPSDKHPVLALLQQYFDPVDALNYAEALFYKTPEGQRPKHVFITYGIGDTYTPPPTIEAFASATRATLLTPVLDAIAGVGTQDPPVDRTWQAGDLPITAVITEAEPNGYDGHFVMFRNERIQRQLRSFMATMARGEQPLVVP